MVVPSSPSFDDNRVESCGERLSSLKHIKWSLCVSAATSFHFVLIPSILQNRIFKLSENFSFSIVMGSRGSELFLSVFLRLFDSLLSISVMPDGSRLLENRRLFDNELRFGWLSPLLDTWLGPVRDTGVDLSATGDLALCDPHSAVPGSENSPGEPKGAKIGKELEGAVPG